MRRPDAIRAVVLVAALLLGTLFVLVVADRSGTDAASGDDGDRLRPARHLVEPPSLVYRMEAFDANGERAAHPVRKGAPLRFAKATKSALTPGGHGRWTSEEGVARWNLEVEAPGSLNLNFGLSKFKLPPSASFELRSPDDGRLLVRPFTALDNDAHGELWTPVVAGERVAMVLTVAERERDQVELEIASINRGFRELSFAAGYEKIGSDAPEGDCHIDVVCSAGASGVGPAIDAYRDQIRSAGVYTLGGVDTCSGAAINNTASDRKPYFLTADHCGVRSSNAPSMVVYWNFENSACRTPNTVEAGEDGDGPLTDFNSGAIFRATWAASDTCLVEMDDPIDPTHGIFLAGWSRNAVAPSMAVGIHHPNTSEKRISFDFDALRSTDEFGSAPNPSGTHWQVIDWDNGTTEPGSSGSPLFDQNGRIVGQLTGGDAACGNDDPDWYGKISAGWTGGGSSSTRLSDWLDPVGTGQLTLDGLEGSGIGVAISPAEVTEGNSGTTVMQFRVELSEAAGEEVQVSYSTQGGAATGGSDYNEVLGALLTFGVGETVKFAEVQVVGDSDPEEHENFEVSLQLVGSPDVVVTTSTATGTILNDDYVPPVIDPLAGVNGAVSQPLSVVVTARNTPTSFGLTGEPAGMTIDNNGTISWVPSSEGTFMATVVASNPAGSGDATIEFVIGNNPLANSVEQTDQGYALTTGGDVEWSAQVTNDSISGGNRAQSGTIIDGQSSWLEVQVEGPEFLGFWWNVSSEEGFDFLNVTVNGESRGQISGTPGWAYRVLALPPGSHTVRWTYSKDGSLTEGLDQGWVDLIQLASRSVPFLMEPPIVYAEVGQPVDYRFPLDRQGATMASTLSGAVQVMDNGEVVGTPSAPGTTSFGLSITQGGNTATVPARMEVRNVAAIGNAVEQPNLRWATSGAGGWVTSSDSNGDGDSARVNDSVPHGESSRLSTVVFGPGQLSFWWKVSSEDEFDFLKFALNGSVLEEISGERGWAQVTVDLLFGANYLEWIYEKDGSEDGGLDRGWVDAVSLEGYAEWIVGQGVRGRGNGAFDLDGDGESQFFDYATGGSAVLPDPVRASSLVSGFMEWSVPKRPNVRDAYFEAQVGSDLENWNTGERTVLQDDATRFRAKDTIGTGTEGHRFIRGLVGPVR